MSNFRPQATESADYNTFLSDNRVDREQDMSWDLSTIVSGRLEYLLDQKTTKVKRAFKPPTAYIAPLHEISALLTQPILGTQVYRQGFSGYPQLYGKLRRNAVESLHLNSEESHMLLVMEKQIKERSVHLRELYSQLDVLGKGSIRVRGHACFLSYLRQKHSSSAAEQSASHNQANFAFSHALILGLYRQHDDSHSLSLSHRRVI